MGIVKNYHVYKTKSGRRLYFRSQWIKSRKTYKLWWVYPRCDDVPIRVDRPGWEIDPIAYVEKARKLKSRPSNKTLTESWLIEM